MGALQERIKELRTQYGLSQVDFSKKMHISKQCASNWENGNVMPSVDMLTKIADFFQVSTDYLLGRVSDDVISTDGLTDEQKNHIRMLIKDLLTANGK